MCSQWQCIFNLCHFIDVHFWTMPSICFGVTSKIDYKNVHSCSLQCTHHHIIIIITTFTYFHLPHTNQFHDHFQMSFRYSVIRKHHSLWYWRVNPKWSNVCLFSFTRSSCSIWNSPYGINAVCIFKEISIFKCLILVIRHRTVQQSDGHCCHFRILSRNVIRTNVALWM